MISPTSRTTPDTNRLLFTGPALLLAAGTVWQRDRGKPVRRPRKTTSTTSPMKTKEIGAS
ncbi:hypothetical protein CVS28_09695 [Arthrobacter glacialis]|nr:hypothetical protein CVS28_09695 [Arthrobacter glacialis]